jgi:hypothetical protein
MNDGDRLAFTRVCTNHTQTSHQNKGDTSQGDLHFFSSFRRMNFECTPSDVKSSACRAILIPMAS